MSPSLETIRDKVAATYARARGSRSAAELAGYRADELASVPGDAADGFLGCGNPLSFIDVKPGETVLDLGCGAGLDLLLAAERVGPEGRVIGVDMTDAMLERARANVARAGHEDLVEVRKGVIERLPVDDASVDWVISNCVISLSPDKQAVFGEVARVLRPGGRMLISDIVVDRGLERLFERFGAHVPSIGSARSETHYLDALAAAGLTGVEVRSRFVYEADHLLGLVEGVESDAPDGCPAGALGRRLRRSAAGRQGLRALARVAAGRVWSAKFAAQRPAPGQRS